MAPPPEPRPDLFPAPLLRVSAPGDLEQLPTKPQPLLRILVPDDLEQLPPKPHELPTNPEEVQAIFSPVEEHSGNNKPEEQSDEDEVATMEETDNQFSSYAAWYKQYENSHHGSEAVLAMVKIPHRMMLDVLLETLGLSLAEYRTRVYDGSRVCVTLLFHTPTSYVGNDKNRMAIPGVQSVDPSISEDTAAMEAIGYIRCTVKTEIRDYNYSTMKKLKEENQFLKYELNMTRYKKKKLKTKIRSIKNKLMSATYKKKQNAMGWFVLTRYMHGFSDRMSNVTALNMSSGKGPMDKIINEPLINIEKVAQRLTAACSIHSFHSPTQPSPPPPVTQT